jgi:hypothetical protein
MEDLSRKIKIDNLKFCNLLTNERGKLTRSSKKNMDEEEL